MALPTVPTAVLNAVASIDVGKASGVNYMARRLGAVIAIAIGSAVFSAYGHLGAPASVTADFQPATVVLRRVRPDGGVDTDHRNVAHAHNGRSRPGNRAAPVTA